MSRTGNIPIEIPDGIDVTLSETNITVKYNSGEKQFKFSIISSWSSSNNTSIS